MSEAELQAKMALLPDYGDNGSSRAATGFGPSLEGTEPGGSPGALLAGGFLSGLMANLALGFVLLGLQRAGVTLFGPGVVAIVVGLILLGLLARPWPRRVWLGAGGLVGGMVLSYAAVYLFVRPALSSALESSAPRPEAPAAAPQYHSPKENPEFNSSIRPNRDGS